MNKIKSVLAAIMAMTLLLTFAGCTSGDYNKAKKLMDQADYAAARELLEPIADYKDAVNLLYTCNYRLLEADIAANGTEIDGVRCINAFFPRTSDDGEYTLFAEVDEAGLHLTCRQKELVGLFAVTFRLDLPISQSVVPFKCEFETAGSVVASRSGTVDITTATAATTLTYAANPGGDTITDALSALTGPVIESAVQECFTHIINGGDTLLRQSGTGVKLSALGFYALQPAETATA